MRFKGLTVRDLLEMAAGKPLEECEVCALVGKVGLCASEYIDREVDASLSGGEQQRVNIARGFIRPSPILLLDEPTASLDGANRQVVIDLIREARGNGAAIVGIFHDDVAREAVADRTIPVRRP